MQQTIQEFFHDFRQELLAGTEAESQFQLAEFMELISEELTATGFVEGFDFCHYRAERGMRVDGYWFNDENALYLFIADFENRDELLSLTRTEVEAVFKRVTNFFEASRNRELYRELEETSPEYGLSREIADRKGQILCVNFFLLSERVLSDRLQTLEDNEIADTPATYTIWDISRLQRQRASRGHKEPLNIDFHEMFDTGISCLRADLGLDSYPSYLIVIPGVILSTLYEKYGSRLLEQNVRSFLQARGKVNRGIRTTIISEPSNFFAYNNGITATAEKVETVENENGLQILRIRDLQIVNGGQTTASLFHTRRKEKVSLERIFVQMKLSVIDQEESEKMVPRISEYANTQNRVSAADFYSNHPFSYTHGRIFAKNLGTRSARRTTRDKMVLRAGKGTIRRHAIENDPVRATPFQSGVSTDFKCLRKLIWQSLRTFGKSIQNGLIWVRKRTLYNLPDVSQGYGKNPPTLLMNFTTDALLLARLFSNELKNLYLPNPGMTVDTGQTLLPTLLLPFVKYVRDSIKMLIL